MVPQSDSRGAALWLKKSCLILHLAILQLLLHCHFPEQTSKTTQLLIGILELSQQSSNTHNRVFLDPNLLIRLLTDREVKFRWKNRFLTAAVIYKCNICIKHWFQEYEIIMIIKLTKIAVCFCSWNLHCFDTNSGLQKRISFQLHQDQYHNNNTRLHIHSFNSNIFIVKEWFHFYQFWWWFLINLSSRFFKH